MIHVIGHKCAIIDAPRPSFVLTYSMSFANNLIQDWFFTQVGGGRGTELGEWLAVSQIPTTVHVELLKLKKIPDPVSILCY